MNLTGKGVHLHGTKGLSITTPSDTIELGEDVSMSSEEIELNVETRQQFPQMISAFEQELARDGELVVSLRRSAVNFVGRMEGYGKTWLNEAKDTVLGIWNFAVDVGDAYQSVTGDSLAPLSERNNLVKGVQQRKEYVAEVWSGEKFYEGKILWPQ